MSPIPCPLPAPNSTQNQLAQRHQGLASPAVRCDHKTTLGPGRREDGAGELGGNSGKSPHRGRVVPCSPLLLPHSWNTDVKAGAQVATQDHEVRLGASHGCGAVVPALRKRKPSGLGGLGIVVWSFWGHRQPVLGLTRTHYDC